MSISSVTSEALQLKLRQLLPSQQGFGTDLSASDTIIPIIDLTGAAEGTDVPEMLQTALAFGSQTTFNVANTTTVLANTAGFYQITSFINIRCSTGGINASLFISDGATNKTLFQMTGKAPDTQGLSNFIQVIVFLRAGDSLSATTSSANGSMEGSIRQVADVNGTLIQPVGFTPQ